MSLFKPLGYLTPLYIFPLYDPGNKPYIECGNANWQNIHSFIFYGTDMLYVDTMKIILSTNGSSETSTANMRLYDYTNQKEIKSITFESDTEQKIFTYNSLSNLPTGETIFEIQLKKGSKSARIYYLALYKGV